MILKKHANNSSAFVTPDQQDIRGHTLFDRNKQKNKTNSIRAFKYAVQLKFEKLFLT